MSHILPLTHLGELPVETFIAEYWHKRPLLIRQAFVNQQWPVSADELAGLACEAEVESRLLIEDPNKGAWQLRHGPFDEAVFSQLPAEHWTLLVQAVDHWVPAAADFIERFRFIPSWRLDDLMISYASQGGGVGPHYDNYDVFLVQAQGQRRWEIGGCYDEKSAFLPDKPVRILKHWKPEQSWVLNPGDMLYLPPRVGHNGVAATDGCVTYSVGFRAPQSGDMLMSFAAFCAARSKEEDRYADPDLSPRLNSGEICRSDLERARSMISRWLEDPDALQEWFGRFMTEPKYPEPPPEEQPVSRQEWLGALEQAQGVRRSEGARFAFSRTEEGLRLFVEGERFDCGPHLTTLVEQLCDQNAWSPAQLLAWRQEPDALALLCRLAERDWLYLD